MDSIVSEIIDEIIEKSCNTVGTSSNDVSTKESAESRYHSCTVVNEIITEILELAYNPRMVNELIDPVNELKNDEKIDQTHSSINVASDSNVGIVVNKNNPCNNNLTDPLVENDLNRSIESHESDESFIVDRIEICKNGSLASAVIISDEPSAIEKVKEVHLSGQTTIKFSPKIDFDQPADIAQENVKREEDVDVLPPDQTTINVSPKIVSNQPGGAKEENVKREGDLDVQQLGQTTINILPKMVSHQLAGMTEVNVRRKEDGGVLPPDQTTINVSPKIVSNQSGGTKEENVKRERDLDVQQLGQTTIDISPKIVSHQLAGMTEVNVKREEDGGLLPPDQATINVSPKIVSNQSGGAKEENVNREGDLDVQQLGQTTINISPKIVSHQPAGMAQENVKREGDLDVKQLGQTTVNISPKIVSHQLAGLTQVNVKREKDVDVLTINVSPKIVSNQSGGAKEENLKREGDFAVQQSNHTTVNVSEEIVSDQPAATNQKNKKGKGDFIQQKPVRMTESTNFATLKERDQFYSTEELHRRGYFTRFSGEVKYVTNLSLPSDTFDGVKVQCRGFPRDMKENSLIPMLEKCGRILELKFENDVVEVKFATNQEARNAIGKFNGQVVQGQPVKVQKLSEKNQLYVNGIPVDATMPVLFHYFNKLTKGLVNFWLLKSQMDETKNRGYCHLMYIDHKSAMDAKEIILKTVYGGRKLYADWASDWVAPLNSQRNKDRTFLTPPPYKLYMNNLRPGLTTSDLRKLFSPFGSVVEVDKNGNWASVKFRHPSETKLAFANVDRKFLGDHKVGLSLTELQE